MRKLILTFVLGTLCLGAFSQEAFYIYRNDGDFNGFFYDEVVEMRQSKIGVDSVEYDRWVTQEVVLADTIYRIPLAAIDSIGFQQPEIKINPKVKFVERDGYSPYLTMVRERYVAFENLPANLKLHEGDVLIGLPTDQIAATKYEESIGYLGSGSFSCVVTGFKYEGNTTYVFGHAVENIGDVFERYITVEQIGVDRQGNIVRRVAGCTPDGLPRKIKDVSDQGEVSLIDFTSNITRQWQPTDNSSIDLSAELGINLKMRASYEITWTRCLVKVSKDLVITTKPSVGLTLSKNIELTTGNLTDITEVPFPSFAPIFATHPIPELFFRAEGKLDARLQLPQVRFGFGDDIIMNSAWLFPVTYTFHMVPDENKEVDDKMLDLTGQVQLSGSAQIGVKLKADISTASWFKKVLMAECGLHMYVGPKVGGEVNITRDVLNSDEISMYRCLSQSHLNIALLSIDFEAKAKASAFWKDSKEKTFWSKSFSFLTDTVYLAPRFDPITVIYDENEPLSATVQIHPKRDKYLGFTTIDIALYNAQRQLIEKSSNFIGLYKSKPDSVYEYTFEKLKYANYYALPIVKGGSYGPLEVWDIAKSFIPPVYMKIKNDSITFGASTNLTQRLEFQTNVIKEGVSCVMPYSLNDEYSSSWLNFDSLVVVDDENGIYQAVITAEKNKSLFERSSVSGVQYLYPYIRVGNEKHDFYVCQQEPDLSNVTVDASGDMNNSNLIIYRNSVTASRSGKDVVTISGNYTSGTETNTISATIQRTGEKDGCGRSKITGSGTLTSVYTDTQSVSGSTVVKTYTYTFNNIEGLAQKDGAAAQLGGVMETGTIVTTVNGEVVSTLTHEECASNYVSIRVKINDPQ